MSYNIKGLKPRKGGHFKQGYFNVTESKKYIEKERPVIYRSGLEFKVFTMLEKAHSVARWCSEPDFIKIKYEFNGKIREYFMDVYVEYTNGKKQLVEVKPYAQTQMPLLSKYSKEAQFHKDLEAYKKNMAKWESAFRFCAQNGMEFKILTEKTIDKYL